MSVTVPETGETGETGERAPLRHRAIGAAHDRRSAARRTVDEYRAAGLVALTAVLLCVVGAILNQGIVDADVYAAMDATSRAEQADLLTAVANDRTSIVVGFAVWMVAFPLFCLASVMLARLGGPSAISRLVRFGATASFGAIIVFLSGLITFTAVIAPAHVAGEDVYVVARALGWSSTTADWVVSAVVLGLAPIAAVVAGRGVWAPRWLQGLALVTAGATVLLIVGLAIDNRDLAFPIVPIGLLLVAASGVCALRHSSASSPSVGQHGDGVR